ncbi:hypothetical protein Nlim_0195 [Candidatus Nitrosarchaeum limnium SFB1]|jgi:hypothetical protein|uniref:UPF0215 protein Nlim_0195 n=1 Tax=Candidatus Nitrosarchaeum limnium SFB1 TaxID=886738 RepID=F3KIA0_9ARCH|nr:hypothetical protein Nlim_0195 [Candidatus Nitrosarchaeum limnium SFB1]
MNSLHLEKKGLRCLAIAESFKQNSEKSILSGLVMRKDFVIDGVIFGSATLRGNDATEQILQMYYDLNRSDINYILLSGLIVSMYNIIDIKKLFSSLKIPVIGIAYHESQGIENALKQHFPKSFETKINEYKKLGKRETITLHTDHNLFVRYEGCMISDVHHLLNDLTLHGSVPEPVRISQLIANALIRKELSF